MRVSESVCGCVCALGEANESQGLLSSDDDDERVGANDEYFKQDLTEDWDDSEKHVVDTDSDGNSDVYASNNSESTTAGRLTKAGKGAQHKQPANDNDSVPAGDEDVEENQRGAASAASLALMVDGTDDGHMGKHFDMTQIIQEHKNKGKKKKTRRSKKKSSRGDDLDEESTVETIRVCFVR